MSKPVGIAEHAKNIKQQCIYCGKVVYTRMKKSLPVCPDWGCQSQDNHIQCKRAEEVRRNRKRRKDNGKNRQRS